MPKRPEPKEEPDATTKETATVKDLESAALKLAKLEREAEALKQKIETKLKDGFKKGVL